MEGSCPVGHPMEGVAQGYVFGAVQGCASPRATWGDLARALVAGSTPLQGYQAALALRHTVSWSSSGSD